MQNDLIGWLILAIALIYVFGKMIFYWKLFVTGEIKFFWQNQFDEYYRGELVGYLAAMVVITYWPLTFCFIRSAYHPN